MDVQATGLDANSSWDPSECQQIGSIVRCLSTDKTTARVKFSRREKAAGSWNFTVSFRQLAATGPFAGPVTVTLTEESTGDSQSGTTTICHASGATLFCK